MHRLLISLLVVFVVVLPMRAQEDISYQQPPQLITDLVDAPPTPLVSVSPDLTHLLLLERPGLPGIDEVSATELRLAGLRINPQNNGPSRSSSYYGLVLLSSEDGRRRPVADLPANARIESVAWSPNGQYIGFTHSRPDGIELWIVDVAQARAKRLTDLLISDALGGSPLAWLPDNRTLLFKAVPTDRAAVPNKNQVPTGPIVQASSGKAAPVRTYQDLLSNKHDEAIFDYYTHAQLYALDISSGQASPFGAAGIVRSFAPSPDGQYIMVNYVHRPYSYQVPYYRFPLRTVIYDRAGQEVRNVADTPLAENIPKGFGAVPVGPRSFEWRSDAPAELYWVEAQDGGDPAREVAVRDQLFYLRPPFSGDPQPGPRCSLRYSGINWGSDDLAIVSERWWSTRREITSRWTPRRATADKQVLFDRSYEDQYNNPGTFEMATNAYGQSVLLTDKSGKYLYLRGQGASPQGNQPFLDRYAIANGETSRLWQSAAPYYEYPIKVMDLNKTLLLTQRESRTEPPNYFTRDWKKGKLTQLTKFKNPYTALDGVQKEMVRYQRADGVEMTGTLYLPAGYVAKRDSSLPVFMWAYPREYKSADAAGQVTDSPYEFIRLSGGSPIFWVTQGYAVFDDFAMPIIGEGDAEPNETFVKQLRDNAAAAIDKLVEMGVADRQRIGVGGHSYGAFMTANLLAHTDLFAAGIARSGAYNRTLTPFGFQAEERTFWEAPEVYFRMSPFMHADQIKEPLLLIHGEADNNSGTFPMQSERFYAALKGHGATSRFVMLPAESHGYRARESVLHMLWEMTEWLDKHVKNRAAMP